MFLFLKNVENRTVHEAFYKVPPSPNLVAIYHSNGLYKAPQSGACGKQGAGLCLSTPSPTSPRNSLYSSLQLPTPTDETPSSVPRGVQEFAAQAAGRLAARSLGFSAPGLPRPCPPLAVLHPRRRDAPAAPRSWCLRLLNQPS